MRDDFTEEEAETDNFYARLVGEYCADSIVITDTEGRTEWVNSAFERISGYVLKDAIGKPPCVLLQGPETDTSTMAQIQRARTERRQFQTEIMHYPKTGAPYWVEMHLNPVFDADGLHTHFVEIERDISARKKLELANTDALKNESRRKEERRLISQTSEWLYSTKSLTELLRVVEVSMGKIFPEAAGELYVYSNSRDALDLVAHWGGAEPSSRHINPSSCWGLRRGRAYAFGTTAIEFPCDHHRSHEVPSFCLPIIAHGETIGLLHLSFPQVDISKEERQDVERKLARRRDLALICAEQISLSVANVQLRQELHDQSTRDPLTSLWNRRWFLEAASKQLLRARDGDHPFTLISLDVDHFKKFNDHHGHDAGDVVLREIGGLMAKHFAGQMHPCRMGGEEFIVLCSETEMDVAYRCAEEFRTLVSDHSVSYGRQLLPQVTISAGLASFPECGSDVVSLMKAADDALYAAKDSGRNRVFKSEELPEKED